MACRRLRRHPLTCRRPRLPPIPAEGVRAVFFPWLAPKPRLTGMQRQAAEQLAAEVAEGKAA